MPEVVHPMPNGDRLTNNIQTLASQDVLRSHATDGGGVFLPDRVITTISAVVVRRDDPTGPKYQEALGYAFNINGSWVPGLTRMDDGTLVLTMTITAVEPHKGVILFSRDDGMSWSPPRPVPASRCTPVNLGGDRLMLRAGNLYFSDDRGRTWSDPKPVPAGLGTDVAMNPLVEGDDVWWIFMKSGGCRDWKAQSVRIRYDLADHTWDKPLDFPNCDGDGPLWRTSEGSITRAKNGDLLAAFRTGRPGLSVCAFDATAEVPGEVPSDHWRGICTTYSTDNGKTWADPEVHFQYGHVHMSLLPFPDGRILMTYVARIGELEGRTYHGTEAVFSHDHGRTWDWERRYIIYRGRTGPMHSSQSQRLSDGRVITTFMEHVDYSHQAAPASRMPQVCAVIWSP